jgi:hypothetical protein
VIEQLPFDREMFHLVALEQRDHLCVVGRELARPIPGDDRHQILRQQVANEMQHPIEPSRRRLEFTASKQNQEDAACRGRVGRPRSRPFDERLEPAGRLCRQRDGKRSA